MTLPGLVALVLASSCVLKTDVVPASFNGGALDSSADPYRDPKRLRESIVARLLVAELADGYYAPNAAVHDPAALGYSVDAWAAAASPGEFAKMVRCVASNDATSCAGRAAPAASGAPPPTLTSAEQKGLAPEVAPQVTGTWTASGAKKPLCSGPGAPPDRGAYARLLDEVRFNQAVARAASAVADKLSERIIEPEDVVAGAKLAFELTAVHLKQRLWHREFAVPTTGLVVKGGSANGIFSAGAVWTVLHLIDSCMRNPSPGLCRANVNYDFKLISGTSTGAMVAVAVDLFNAAPNATARQAAIDKLVRWFTCFSVNDLYCVDSRPITNLIGNGDDAQLGVLRFDGIAKVMNSCVDDAMFRNRSELVLNSVDFRSGRLFSLSDQTELLRPSPLERRSCVIQAALASALLPLIGAPVKDLPAIPDRPFDANRRSATEPIYLDGGIRSEIPLLPLARRGAERVLVISSSASVLNETKRLRNGAAIAARYIDVNTGALSETELAHAQRHVESMRLEEINACFRALRADDRRLCKPETGCDWNICLSEGLRDERVWDCSCSFPHGGAAVPAQCADLYPAPGTPGAQAAAEASQTKTVTQRIDPVWRVQGVFRPESKVDGVSGYDFDPPELQRLFRAGAEAARQRCVEIAALLGIVGKERVRDPAARKRLVDWCSPEFPRAAEACVYKGTSLAARGNNRELRDCANDVAPPHLDDCAPSSALPACGAVQPATSESAR